MKILLSLYSLYWRYGIDNNRTQKETPSPENMWNHFSQISMQDNEPWQPVTLSAHVIKSSVYVVSWPPSVNTEVHPATPCMPPASTFRHSTMVKAKQRRASLTCTVDTVGVHSGGRE